MEDEVASFTSEESALDGHSDEILSPGTQPVPTESKPVQPDFPWDRESYEFLLSVEEALKSDRESIENLKWPQSWLDGKTRAALPVPPGHNAELSPEYQTAPDCPICFDRMSQFPLSLTACGHVFHAQCLSRWIYSGKACCPNCREDVDAEGIFLVAAAPVAPVLLVETSVGTPSEPLIFSALAHAHRVCTEIAVVLRTKWSEVKPLESSLRHLFQDEQKLTKVHEKEASSLEESVRKRVQQSSAVESERRKWVDYCRIQKHRLEKLQLELESCRELENSLASEQRTIEQEQATSQHVTHSGIRASKASLAKLLDEKRKLEDGLKALQKSAPQANQVKQLPDVVSIKHFPLTSAHSHTPKETKKRTLADTVSLPESSKAPSHRTIGVLPGKKTSRTSKPRTKLKNVSREQIAKIVNDGLQLERKRLHQSSLTRFFSEKALERNAIEE
ncbi:hypothetical protein NDN08_001422 [Rhodosorus marinus]|uniref:RING-type domain-containing protein n=1 Tax=Rhodosorus marinus TaxID=101924 RepID=A0AAV8UQX3_9RHOD|nr:hypothetical protein NDN08_001422 [Rhodosorus marinus]